MPEVDSVKTYKHNDPLRPFTELTWQLVASMIAEDSATPAEIASLFNRDPNDVMSKIKDARESGYLARIIDNLPQDVPEQAYRDLASRILWDAHKDTVKMTDRSKKTVKTCRKAIKVIMGVTKFVNTGWAETLCRTANIDPEAYREVMENELQQFWASVSCPLARKVLTWLNNDQEQFA